MSREACNFLVSDEPLGYYFDAEPFEVVRLGANVLGMVYKLAFQFRECWWLSYTIETSQGQIVEAHLVEPVQNSKFNGICKGMQEYSVDASKWDSFKNAIDAHRKQHDELNQMARIHSQISNLLNLDSLEP